MEIKQFKVLSTPQKNELFDFIKNTDLTYNKSYVEMIRIYESDTFNYGDTVFILFHQGEIKGSVAIITKEIINVGEAFITDIYVEKKNEEKYLCFLIEEVTKYCSICSARSIKIGIRKNEIQLIPYINKMEFTHIYDAMVMRYRKGENMKFLIIESHPYEKSFNRQLSQSIKEVLDKKHSVEVINLIQDKFNPVIESEDLKVFASGKAADEKVYEYQKKIHEADILVFVFPIWWGVMPAILKGFIDKVFLKDFAYVYAKMGLKGLLNKKAVVVTTMETPKVIYNTFGGNPVKNQFIKGTLGMSGINTEKHFQIDKINSGTDEYRKDEYNKVVQYFQNM